MIDINKLKQDSIKLNEMLSKYSKIEPIAEECLRQLEPIFKEILKGKPIKPYKKIPCGYHFHEGDLRKYSDLEEAYSKFAFRAEGRDENAMNDFFAPLG